MPSNARTSRLIVSLVFAYLWLMAGFFTGTLVLLGPVQWLASFSRGKGWPQTTENLLVRVAIALFIIGSALLAVWLTRLTLRKKTRAAKACFPLLTTALAAAAAWLWMNPHVWMRPEDSSRTEVVLQSSAGAQFTFGPYPTEERLRNLKRNGFAGVISLLHPAVVPFEPKLLADEKELAARVEIELIHAPLLPWVGENEQSLQTIRKLVEKGQGRYYVHCYLGRDRINLVKRIIREVTSTGPASAPTEESLFANQPALERGKIFLVDKGIYLIPFPTDSEIFDHILSTSVRHVVCLLDPVDASNLSWIEKERQMLASSHIPFLHLPIALDPFDPQTALHAAEEVRKLDRPVVVHAFLSDFSRSPAAEAFFLAYQQRRPLLPSALFVEQMEAGPVRCTTPHLALGPRPAPSEFGGYLYHKGIRNVLYVGDPETPECREDTGHAAQAGLKWHALPASDASLVDIISSDGPWYLYGPQLPWIEKDLAK